MFHQKSAKRRNYARLNFRDTLCPEEQLLFDDYVDELEEKWKKEIEKRSKQ